MTLALKAGASTDVGRVRAVNQDSFLVLADRGLYVVADGMGGHQGGEVASSLAVEAMRATYLTGSIDALAEAIEEANVRIHEEGAADPELRGMGTTVVAVAAVPDDAGDDTSGSLLVANVGDSRAYLFRDGDLVQITEDHSMVADLVREGRITEAEADHHPQRNIVTRVLGVYDQVDVDLWPVDAVRGDRILLCSDGLFTEVAADQIAAVLRRLADPQEAADELVRRAVEAGGRDNVTVLVVDVLDDGGVAEEASAAIADRTSGLASREPDLAGFANAPDGDDAPVVAAKRRRLRRKDRRERAPRPRRITWRVVGFVLLLVAVFGGAYATVWYYGTQSFYVGYREGQDDGRIVIYRGRPGGILTFDPKVEEVTDATDADVRPQYLDALREGSVKGSLDDARRYVDRITTTTTTTSTTVPVTEPDGTPIDDTTATLPTEPGNP